MHRLVCSSTKPYYTYKYNSMSCWTSWNWKLVAAKRSGHWLVGKVAEHQGHVQDIPQSWLQYGSVTCFLCASLYSGFSLRHCVLGVACKNYPYLPIPPSKWLSVSANQSCSFNWKWLPAMEVIILLRVSANHSCSFKWKWLLTMEATISEAPNCKTPFCL